MDKFSSLEVFSELRQLTAKYSFLEVFPIGFSLMNKPLLCARIGRGKKQVLYSAAHHGNEWITALLLTRFLKAVCQGLQEHGTLLKRQLHNLFEEVTLFALPLINPDGADLAGGTLTEGEFFAHAESIAAKYPFIPFPRGWKANIRGVDLNLQYPADWQEVKRRKTSLGFSSPAPRDFPGLNPISEPESQALFRFTKEHSFDFIIALHTQGAVIYDRYKGYAPNGTYPLVKKMSYSSGYPLESTPAESDGGGYKDWFISAFDKPGITVECGLGESPLPLSQLDAIYTQILPILILGLEG